MGIEDALLVLIHAIAIIRLYRATVFSSSSYTGTPKLSRSFDAFLMVDTALRICALVCVLIWITGIEPRPRNTNARSLAALEMLKALGVMLTGESWAMRTMTEI